jgi:uncharacterized protein (TIGR00369 family)
MGGSGSRAADHAPLPASRAERWGRFGQVEGDGGEYFINVVGIVVEEIREDYCRMRLPWRRQITQPAGVAHGGALATLLDAVVVPAIGSGYDDPVGFSTVDLHVQYLNALVDEDALAEGWIVQRGRSMVFCEAEIVGATSGRLVARAVLTYKLLGPRAATPREGPVRA